VSVDWTIRYDRRVRPAFLEHFLPGGVAASLAEYAKHAPYPVDLQMRHDPKTGADHASVYVGLSSVLNVDAKGGGLALSAHETFRTGPWRFNAEWRSAAAIGMWRERWADVEEYLERVIPAAAKTHASKEGSVQAAVSAFDSEDRVMLDREVTPHFRDTAVKNDILDACRQPIVAALNKHVPAPGKIPQSFGAECDLLALDTYGRLLAIEVKPSTGTSIAWSSAQATMYARVLRAWVTSDHGWREVIDGMYDQRRKLGLASKLDRRSADGPVVVPVVALQRGVGRTHIERLWAVQDALLAEGVGEPQMEVYEVSLSGRLGPIRRH
jgi:hypothetical protein